MYSYLVDDNSEAKGVNEHVVATISHNEYKGVLLNKKCLRHSINRIQNKDHRMIERVKEFKERRRYVRSNVLKQKKLHRH